MRRAAVLACLLLAGSASADTGADVGQALVDLSSPFEEARRRAVRILAHAGEEAVAPLLALYPDADYRTKALVLEALGEAGDPAGVALVRSDLESPDRGVVRAQHEYVSALFAVVRNRAAVEIAARLGEDWRTEEAIRCLPGPGETPRGALRRLLRSGPPRLRKAAGSLARRVEVLDELREWLAARTRDAAPEGNVRARALLERMLRHDVERAMLAVHEAGSEGYYDGMYGSVREIVEREGGGRTALEVLGRIVRDEAWPEAGVRRPPDDRYRHLEPVPRDLGRLGVRQTAAQCIGDVAEGHPDFASALADWLHDERPEYDRIETVDYSLALALAGLGETGPIEDAIRELSDGVSRRRPYEYLWERCLMRLAGCYARLGRYEEAAEQYRYFFRATRQSDPVARYNLACVLTKDGRTEEALRELARAVEAGYGTDPSEVIWLERDGDLAGLRDDPAYAKLLEEARRR